jgi:hypothetical protein
MKFKIERLYKLQDFQGITTHILKKRFSNIWETLFLILSA